MAYSTSLITLPSEADQLIAMATRDKRTLVNRKEALQIRSESSVENSQERASELASAKAALASVIAQIAILDGEDKENQITKKMELEVKIRKLSKSDSKGGSLSILETEYDADLLERQIMGMDAFVSAVTDRKAQLP